MAFVPGADATLASALRGSLKAGDSREIVACVVQDAMSGRAGVDIRAPSAAHVAAALRDAVAAFDALEATLFAPPPL